MKKVWRLLLAMVLVFTSIVPAFAQNDTSGFKLGVEVLLTEQKDLIKGKRVGLITNPTGVDQNLNHIVDLLHEDEEIDLVALYGPEHGVRGDAQAGSQVESYVDEQTGITVHSLYGATKKPTPEMLEGVDVLIFDIQDVGARFYTYIYTMAYAMQAAQENGIEIIVLDRPNPLGGDKVSGPVLEEKYSSFVGMYPIPVIHGMTVGELANYFNTEFDINAKLTVVPMKNWNRNMLYDDTGLELVLPSPNMPTTKTIQVYPGAGFFEGTNMSEGRGTTKPFELIGAPFVNAYDFAKAMNEKELPGVRFRAASFTPTMSKHKGELSHGVQIHVTNSDIYDPLRVGLEMIIKLNEMYPEDFIFTPNWNNTSYFFDTLMGNSWVREAILEGKSYDEIEAMWSDGLSAFRENRKQHLIYDNEEFNKDSLLEKIESMKSIDKDKYTDESVSKYLEELENLEKELQKALTTHELDKIREALNGLEDLLIAKDENPNPETPGEPETPEEPETPGEPETPEEPEAPGEPETPEEPEAPGEPETPEEPSPEEPENPGENDEELIFKPQIKRVDKKIDQMPNTVKDNLNKKHPQGYDYKVFDISIKDQFDKEHKVLDKAQRIEIPVKELGFTEEQLKNITILNLHYSEDGKLELIGIEGQIGNDKLVFESDKFSDFIIASENLKSDNSITATTDKNKSGSTTVTTTEKTVKNTGKNPKTGDTGIVLELIALLGAGGASVVLYKKRR